MKCRNSSRLLICGLGLVLVAFAACQTVDNLNRLKDDCNRGIQNACDSLDQKCNELLNPSKKEVAPDPVNDVAPSSSGSISSTSSQEGFSFLELAILMSDSSTTSNQLRAGGSSSKGGAVAGGIPSGVSKEDACAVCSICATRPSVKIPDACSSCSSSQS